MEPYSRKSSVFGPQTARRSASGMPLIVFEFVVTFLAVLVLAVIYKLGAAAYGSGSFHHVCCQYCRDVCSFISCRAQSAFRRMVGRGGCHRYLWTGDGRFGVADRRVTNSLGKMDFNIDNSAAHWRNGRYCRSEHQTETPPPLLKKSGGCALFCTFVHIIRRK